MADVGECEESYIPPENPDCPDCLLDHFVVAHTVYPKCKDQPVTPKAICIKTVEADAPVVMKKKVRVPEPVDFERSCLKGTIPPRRSGDGYLRSTTNSVK